MTDAPFEPNPMRGYPGLLRPATLAVRQVRSTGRSLRGVAIEMLADPRPRVALRVALVVAVVCVGVWQEFRTSAVQSLLLSTLAARLSYRVDAGASGQIVFPSGGPLDRRLGYARLPGMTARLEARGYRLTEQARFSPGMVALAAAGVPPPYSEPSAAGLVVRGRSGDSLYDARSRAPRFERYQDVPPLVVRSLLFIEDRQLESRDDRWSNPTLNWGRLALATLRYARSQIGLGGHIEGGSTLATQIEKYRHSDGGRTDSPVEKLRQIVAASLKAYRGGPDTRAAREAIVTSYLNTVPLASVPGHGEVTGLSDGLKAWFGLDPDEVYRALASPVDTPEKARAYHAVLSLLCAVRAPTDYLTRDRAALEERVGRFARLLAQTGVISADLARDAMAAPLVFASAAPPLATPRFGPRKASDAVRREIRDLLGVRDLYDLDRMDLAVETSFDGSLQDSITRLFTSLRDPAFVASHGLRGERLLATGDPKNVIYGMLLYERTPAGDVERVHLDNLDEPFDVNSGMKMELGSTAKLRALSHYLELVEGLHGELSGLSAATLRARAHEARDSITAWAAATLAHDPDMSVDRLLERSLERRYKASPNEVFFTGGGIHHFHNFDPLDDSQTLTIREAAARSTNLVFIRLMRDIVRFHAARLPYDARAVMNDDADPTRRRLLDEIADGEAREALAGAWRRLQGLPPDGIIDALAGQGPKRVKRLAILFFALHPGATPAALDAWITPRAGRFAPRDIDRLARAYGARPLTLQDQAWLLSRHPLELWCAERLLATPGIGWDALVDGSAAPRRDASQWLLGTRHRHAQDLRLAIRIEQDAFERMTPDWRRLEFPFPRLVPSLATAIGSSSDRPAALASLMGVILGGGIRQPAPRVRALIFGRDTPYHTAFEAAPAPASRIMSAPVARMMRSVLADVVDHGTAVRVRGAFTAPDGTPLVVGGKTGSGDNRFQTFARDGTVKSSRAVSRTAAFVFYIGERHYGIVTASVLGPEASAYTFTSSLPLAVLAIAAPAIQRHLEPEHWQARPRPFHADPLLTAVPALALPSPLSVIATSGIAPGR